MIKRLASAIAVLAVAVALGLKLMVRTPMLSCMMHYLVHQSNPLLQTRVNLPGHVLGHPCLYYPNFISQEVASQVSFARVLRACAYARARARS